MNLSLHGKCYVNFLIYTIDQIQYIFFSVMCEDTYYQLIVFSILILTYMLLYIFKINERSSSSVAFDLNKNHISQSLIMLNKRIKFLKPKLKHFFCKKKKIILSKKVDFQEKKKTILIISESC